MDLLPDTHSTHANALSAIFTLISPTVRHGIFRMHHAGESWLHSLRSSLILRLHIHWLNNTTKTQATEGSKKKLSSFCQFSNCNEIDVVCVFGLKQDCFWSFHSAVVERTFSPKKLVTDCRAMCMHGQQFFHRMESCILCLSSNW